MKFKKLIFTTVFMAILSVSCTDDNATIPAYNPRGHYDSGVFVLNEGNFQTDNASVSYISFDLSASENDIFTANNPNAILGDTAQSIGFYGDNAYIVVNASNKIEVVNRYTMKQIATINSGLNQPRYIAFANGKAYVTNWTDSASTAVVAVIDLATNTVTSNIPVAGYPNKIVENAGKLYVSHNDLASVGNTISVINPDSNIVSGSINVGSLPDDMYVDGTTLWVSCQGVSRYPVAANESAGKILKVSLDTNTVTETFVLGSNSQHVGHFAVSGPNAYYTINSDVYKFAITEHALPLNAAFSASATNLYGFGVNNGRIYVGDAKNFDSNGEVKVYSAGTLSDAPAVGTLLKTATAGVGPNGFYFNL